MSKEQKGKTGGHRERFKLLWARSRGGQEAAPSNRASDIELASPDAVAGPSAPPERTGSDVNPSSEPAKQNSPHPGLWERAADSLDQEAKKELEQLMKNNQKSTNGHAQDSPSDDVILTLHRAGKLKEEVEQSSGSTVVNKIIKAVLAFKAVGDAVVKFDKSGYAALGWSIVSFGLQVASNAGEAREFVLSSSETLTRFMATCREYELFRGPEAGDEFDQQLTNVYKAILLYMIALDQYLHQDGLARLAHSTLKLQDRSINSKHKALVDADAEISHWLVIISQKRSDNSFSQIRTLLQDRPLPESDMTEPSQECIRSLAFPGMDSRFNDIERAAEGTCKWLLGHETYRDWAADGSMLCIKGKPGSGKSTLLQYAVMNAVVGSNIRDRSLSLHNAGLPSSEDTGLADTQLDPGALILSFFFHDRGTELQKTTLGLYRSLLHQVLRYIPDAMPDDLLATYRDRVRTVGEPGEKWHWHWSELRDFFGSSLRNALKKRPVCLLIDALDEYGEDNANQLIKSFTTWIRDRPSQAQLRICFTCRHHPRLDLPQAVSEIQLESENGHDISEYVRSRLTPWPTSEHVAAIQILITNRASGVFIWARVIVDRVLKLQREGENWARIEEEVEQSSLELHDLYRGLIGQVTDRGNSFKLIQWICFAMEPLTLTELRWAMVVEPDLSYSPNSLRHYQSSKYFASDNEMMWKKLTALSCGLAEVVPSRYFPLRFERESDLSACQVQFIHQTVKDFFITEGLYALQNDQNPSITKTNGADLEAIAHYKLSRTCLRYLSTDEIHSTLTRDKPTAEYQMGLDFSLLTYATMHLGAHIQESDGANTPNDLLSYFGWPSESMVNCWLVASRRAGRYMYHPIHMREGTTLLHLASANRWMSPLLEIMERKKALEARVMIDAFDADGYTPLILAALEGHSDVVQLLLTNGANVDGRGGNARTPLLEATYRGKLDVVRVLLENGADMNAVASVASSSALALASIVGYEQIVSMLLQNGADVNGPSGGTSSPLIGAVTSSHGQIVKILLEHGADVNAQFKGKECALGEASEMGDEQIVSMLLKHGANVNGPFGYSGSPLIRAARDGHGPMVKILLEHGADVNAHSKWYGCALAAAVWACREQGIVRMLLENGADMNARGGDLHENRSILQMVEGKEDILQIFREFKTA